MFSFIMINWYNTYSYYFLIKRYLYKIHFTKFFTSNVYSSTSCG